MPHIHLILVADAASARIFELGPPTDGLRLLYSWTNGDGRRLTRELVADRMGYKARLATGWLQSVSQPTDPARREERRFAKVVAQHLDRLLEARPRVRLALLCSPRFLGELRTQLSSRVQRNVDVTEAIELSGFGLSALAGWLHNRLGHDPLWIARGRPASPLPRSRPSLIPPRQF